jgi:hypothetical protein
VRQVGETLEQQHRDRGIDKIFLQDKEFMDNDEYVSEWVSRNRNHPFDLRQSSDITTIMERHGVGQDIAARGHWSEKDYAAAVQRYVNNIRKTRIQVPGSDTWQIRGGWT